MTLIPWRSSGDIRRTWCWDVTRPYLEDLGYELFTGEPPFKEWARSHAINAASAAAGSWDIALIGDADTIPDPGSIQRAVAWVSSTGGAARPHHDRNMLTKSGARIFAQRGPGELEHGEHYTNKWGGGGLLVMTRDAWEIVGGYDERFIGWGHEDSAMTLALLRKSVWDRLPGTAWHLWHPEITRARPESVRMYRQLLTEHRDDIERWARDKGLGRKAEDLF